MDLANMFQRGDTILIITLFILFVMSVISWSIAITKGWRFLVDQKGNKQCLDLLQESDDLASIAKKLKKLDSPMSKLVLSILKARGEYHEENLIQLQQQINFDEFISRKIKKTVGKEVKPYHSWLIVLASIGSMAPFIGLFGTVIGIYNALINISTVGQVSIAEVAGPIGEALIATAFGLFVAVPAVMFYNIFIRISKNFTVDLGQLADDMMIKIANKGDGK